LALRVAEFGCVLDGAFECDHLYRVVTVQGRERIQSADQRSEARELNRLILS
jgi:hypothetical protein